MVRHSRPRIGIDLLVLSQFSDTGMVTYAAEILPRLFRELKECDWVLFAKQGHVLPFDVGEFGNVKVVHSAWMSSSWLWKLCGVTVEPWLRGVDVLFIPVSRVPIVKSCKVVAFVHDLGFLTMPEYLDAGTLGPTRVAMRQAAKTADMLLTNSVFSRREFCSYYKVPEDRVRVTYLGYDECLFRESSLGEEEAGTILDKYGIRKPYVLYLGVIQGRKNLTALVEAATLWKARRPDLQLVLAGKRGWNCESIYEAAGKAQDVVRVTGRIEREHLPVLYANAECYVLPSLYEGFGMPVVESMACGTPNVLSDRAALPEIGGDAAVYFDATNVAEMSERILRVVEDEALRGTLRESGIARARNFTWEKVGLATAAALQSVLPR